MWLRWRDDLSADELREIFDRDIAPTLTASGAAELHPSAVFVGAQPGAGKSRAIADVIGDHPVSGRGARARRAMVARRVGRAYSLPN